MKNVIVVAVCLVSLNLGACASMKRETFSKLKEGDPASSVTALFGQPDEFKPAPSVPNASLWTYKKRGEICLFAIDKDKIAAISCFNDPNYVGPLSNAFKEMAASSDSSGPVVAPYQSVNCTSTLQGNMVATSCY